MMIDTRTPTPQQQEQQTIGKRTHEQQRSFARGDSDNEEQQMPVDQETPRKVVKVLQPKNVQKNAQGKIWQFCRDKDGKKVDYTVKKQGKHYLSLWKDETLQPRDLEEVNEDGDIFQIIMPWAADKAKEDRELMPAHSSQQEQKTITKGSSVQSKLSFFAG